MPSPLRAVLAALFGVNLSVDPVKVSPRARGAAPDPEEGESLVPEPETGKRGKGKKEKGKKSKKGRALVVQPEEGSILDDADEDDECEPSPRGRLSRQPEPRGTGHELACSKHGRKAEKKAGRDKVENKASARSEREDLVATAAAAPKTKNRGKEESRASSKSRKNKHGADDAVLEDGVDIPLRITHNQYRKFAEEDDEPPKLRANSRHVGME